MSNNHSLEEINTLRVKATSLEIQNNQKDTKIIKQSNQIKKLKEDTKQYSFDLTNLKLNDCQREPKENNQKS